MLNPFTCIQSILMLSSIFFFQKLALFPAMDNPKRYCIPDLSVSKNCYCLFKTLQPKNGTCEGGTGGIFKVISFAGSSAS